MKPYLLSLLACLWLPASSASADPPSATPIFDGQSLKGWEYDPKHWRCENGAIVGEIPAGESLKKNTWIVWRGGELKDFDLRLQVKLTGAAAANSGIQFRCQVRDVDHVSGYQADLDQGATWLGRIYDEHGRKLLVERGRRVKIDVNGQRQEQVLAPANQYAVLFRNNDWNDYRIVAIGERVAVFVNGTLFSEFIDRQQNERDLTGSLAFQLHSGPETRVEFRDITLETLDPDDQRLGQFRVPKRAEERPKDAGTLPRNSSGQPMNFDFETGNLAGWTAAGKAFEGQPISVDGIAKRWPQQSSKKQGRYFIGGWEIGFDKVQGTLTSQRFRVTDPYASFLIAGGSTHKTRVELFRPATAKMAEQVVSTTSGNNREQMERVLVDLREHRGSELAVRLIDESSGPWGHLNFDDFRLHATRPSFSVASERGLANPLLHHLLPNPAAKSNPNADHPGHETLAKMHVPEGFSVDLIAAEPELHQPMAFTFDAKGRLWVVEGHSYPVKRAKGEGIDRILIFEDTNGDGSFETRKQFIEGLNLVSGLQVGHGGVWVGAAPELLFIPDRDGNDQPDGPPQVLLNGFGFADTHETLNSFVWGPDGWLYGNQGVFNQSMVGKPNADETERKKLAAGVWRYHPTRHEFEVFAHGGSNQWGLDFDDHGQLFMTHCRSNWGRGATTHVIQGAHYWTQTNNGYAPFISHTAVAGRPTMKNYMLASARYGHGEGGAGKRGSREVYGGHSHVGTMIYLGHNWPAEYRNHLFTHNLHGHQINHQVNRRRHGGYNTVHAGSDVFFCSDRQYIGVDLQYGPDGAVYISDWYDPRHCHSPHQEQWDRGNGRMYRMKYDATYRSTNVDYTVASDDDLVQAQFHPNEWHVRMARLVLAERSSLRAIQDTAVARLQEIATSVDSATAASDTTRLRAIWCLHGIEKLTPELSRRLAQDPSEIVRAWNLQLSVESLDATHCAALLRDSANEESSLLVRRYLASAAARVDSETAWQILEQLASQTENSGDRDLPLLIWFALAPLVDEELDRVFKLAQATKIPAIADYIHWYAPQLSQRAREMIVTKLETISGAEQADLLRLFSAGLSGMRRLEQPDAWTRIAGELYESSDLKTRRAAETVGAAFGDEALFDRMRKQLTDDSKKLKAKQHALAVLSSDSSDRTIPALLKALGTPELTASAIAQLKSRDDMRVSDALIERLPHWTGSENEAAMEALCSRTSWARLLLDAIDREEVDPSRLTAFYARQMASLGDEDLNTRLVKQWGMISQTSGETKATIEKLVRAYNDAPKWAFDRNSGEATFKKLCANCHLETENAPRIGPKLEGSGSKGIGYIVENIVDPNAVIGKDFQARSILTVDGLVVTGVILRESESAITIRTANSSETIAKDDIEQIIVSQNSFMPEGLLNSINERQKIELFLYLMSLR